jgi:hypothetical protein
MALHGKFGNNVFDGTALANLQTVDLTRVGDAHDVSSMGLDWSQQLTGLTDFSVSAEGKSQIGLDTIALLGSGGENEIVLQTTTASYTGAAILESFTETAVVDDVISVSYSIQGNDAEGLTFAATGTAGIGDDDTIHGKHIDAEYVAGTSFADIRGWTVTASVPLSDVTVATSPDPGNSGRLKIAGIKTATATVTILTPAAALPVNPGDTVVALQLWRVAEAEASGFYKGVAICTGADAGISTTGEEVTVLSFVYNGTVILDTVVP